MLSLHPQQRVVTVNIPYLVFQTRPDVVEDSLIPCRHQLPMAKQIHRPMTGIQAERHFIIIHPFECRTRMCIVYIFDFNSHERQMTTSHPKPRRFLANNSVATTTIALLLTRTSLRLRHTSPLYRLMLNAAKHCVYVQLPPHSYKFIYSNAARKMRSTSSAYRQYIVLYMCTQMAASRLNDAQIVFARIRVEC